MRSQEASPREGGLARHRRLEVAIIDQLRRNLPLIALALAEGWALRSNGAGRLLFVSPSGGKLYTPACTSPQKEPSDG